MRDVTQALAEWLAAGRTQIGQIAIGAGADFELRHIDDLDHTGLETHSGHAAAQHLANLDDAGQYRPLKTAPNLRHGWQLTLRDVAELRLALDYFYPAMLGVWLSHLRGELPPVPLRATLGRQTGMYRVTNKITDAQADALCGEFCRSSAGCLKTILWRIDDDVPLTRLPRAKFDPTVSQLGTDSPCIPLLCHEACNLLVAAARTVVKQAPSPAA